MKIKVLAFGFAADVIGERNFTLELPQATSTDELQHLLEEKYHRLKDVLTYSIAVNQSYISSSVLLKENDEVAIIPPVSGG